MDNYVSASRSTARAMAAMVSPVDGHLESPEVKDDICFYYKLPTLLMVSGYAREANAVLDYIKGRFLRENGDVHTDRSGEGPKTVNGALCEHDSYTNVWVCTAAQRLGRFDVAVPMYNYLKNYLNPELGGFTTNGAYNAGHRLTDILTCSHFGLQALYFGDLPTAVRVGDLLKRFQSLQDDLEKGYYIRMAGNGSLIKCFPDEAAVFHIVQKKQGNQAYFFLGYPVAFLCKLYMASNDASYLTSATSILDFCLTCDASIYSFHFAHKVAWGAALVARLTSQKKYGDLSRRIADFLLSLQGEDGLFLREAEPHDRIDQSVEIAIWLNEIQSELTHMK